MSKARAYAHHLILALCLPCCAPDEDTKIEPETAAPSPGGPAQCQGPQTAADQLLAAAQTCTTDSDCISTKSINAPCLLAFLCPFPVARTADLDRLQTEAQRLSTEFASCTSGCAIASCVAGLNEPAVCNTTTKRCELQRGQTAAAGAQSK